MRLAWDVLRRPTKAFTALKAHPQPIFGLTCAAALGLTWSVFAAALAIGGHHPTMTRGLPVEADVYYATAALYLTPLWIALASITARVAFVVGRRLGGTAEWLTAFGAFGPAYTLPLLVLFVVPDIIAYAAIGHGALGRVTPIFGSIALILVTARMIHAIRLVHGLSWGRATTAALAAAVVQAPIVAWLVR